MTTRFGFIRNEKRSLVRLFDANIPAYERHGFPIFRKPVSVKVCRFCGSLRFHSHRVLSNSFHDSSKTYTVPPVPPIILSIASFAQ